MDEATKTELKPYHESIVAHISGDGARSDDVGGGYPGVRMLAEILKSTKAPKNHDNIIEAWEDLVRYYGFNHDFGVVESLKEQKAEAEAAEAKKKKLEPYAPGKAPPGLTPDGFFDSPEGERVKQCVGKDGKPLVVDSMTRLFIEQRPDFKIG